MKFLKLMFLVMFLAAGVGTWAQQPQTQTAPTISVNARYVNGVAPGYAPTAGAGLILNLSSGTANCYGTIVTYAGGTLTMTASTTNFIYLNTGSSCVPAVKTTAFTASDIPIATVVAGSSAITSIADDRTMFQQAAGTGGSSLSIDGTSVGTPNLDSTTPAPDSGYTLGKWKRSGVNISVETPISGAGSLVAGAKVVFTGDSLMKDDSRNTLGATITSTAASCTSAGLCTITAANTYTAGQWVDFGGSGFSPSCLSGGPSGIGYYGTGTELFQVLAAGLSSTQFEVQTLCSTVTGTGGTVEDATYFMSVQTMAKPIFAGVNAAYLRNGVDVASIYNGYTGLVCEQATNFSAMFGDLLPSVTGKQLYFLEAGGINDEASNESVSIIEGCFQSFWAQAHAAGAFVVQNLIPWFGTTTNTTTLNAWLINQGKSTGNASSGQFWDYAGVDMRVFGAFSNPVSAASASSISQAWSASIESPGTSGFTLAACSPTTDCPNLDSPNYWSVAQYGTAGFFANSGGSAPGRISWGITYSNNIPTFQINWENVFGPTSYSDFYMSDNSTYQSKTSPGYQANCFNPFFSFGSSTSVFSVAPTACFSLDQTNTGQIDVGTGALQSKAGSLAMLNMTLGGYLLGATTAPTGSCMVEGWEFTQDGKASYCNGSTWSQPFSSGGVTSVAASSPLEVNGGAGPATGAVTVSCPTCGTSSGGTSVGVNGGSALANLNINATSPTPDSGNVALTPKISSSNAIIEAPLGSSSVPGLLQCGSGTTCSGGVITASGGSSGPVNLTSSLTVSGCTVNSANACVMGTAGMTISFSGIPSTYTNLRLMMTVMETGSSSDVTLQFNSDTSSDYQWNDWSTAGPGSNSSQSSAHVCYQGTLSGPAILNVDINGYSNTAFSKTLLSSCYSPASYSDFFTYMDNWNSTSAISSIKVANTGPTNFAAGTTFQIWGY